jgi:hypothetical protein
MVWRALRARNSITKKITLQHYHKAKDSYCYEPFAFK